MPPFPPAVTALLLPLPPFIFLRALPGWPGRGVRESNWPKAIVGGGLVGSARPVVPNLGPPDVLGLQLPETPASTAGGEGFWELQSKNTWLT